MASRLILVFSAFEPELAALRGALRRAGVAEAEVRCLVAGIGAIDAAVGAARAIAEYGPGLVLFTGTAGCYARDAVGGVVVGRRVVLASTAAVRRDGYLPAPMVVRIESDSGVRKALATAGRREAVVGDVATPLAITTGALLAARLAHATGAAAENLEAFAVGRAATLAGIPFGVVLGISNQVGPGAHVEWLRHQEAASQAAARVLETFLLARLRKPVNATARPTGGAIKVSPRKIKPVRETSRSNRSRRPVDD